MPILASQLYALSQSKTCSGSRRCHWCGAPCDQSNRHDDPPPLPFFRASSRAFHPSENYVCVGCWLWRRPRVEVAFLAGGRKTGQCARNHSWWVTEKGAWAVAGDDRPAVWELLRSPPHRFCLALRDGEVDNHLQLCLANDFADGIKKSDTLRFTLNSIPHQYTLCELEDLAAGVNVTSPGLAALSRFLGPPPFTIVRVEEDLKRGRPAPLKDGRVAGEVAVVASGLPAGTHVVQGGRRAHR